MASWERGYTNAVNRMGRVEIDCFDQRKGRQVVVLCIKGSALIRRRRRIADSNVVLDKPFVDRLGRMGHENAALEVGLAKDVWERGGVVNVETR